MEKCFGRALNIAMLVSPCVCTWYNGRRPWYQLIKSWEKHTTEASYCSWW